jgi:2-dehydropantoate 2-reductase
MVCVKSQHTEGALDDLRSSAGSEVAVVCTQNGVANERVALRRFTNVYAMVVILPAVHLQPGVVVTHAKGVGGILDLGCYPAGVDGRAEAIGRALTAAGFSARPDARVMRWKYAKLLMNLDNALQAATEMAEGAREISRQMKKEALACYAAAGIDCATVDEVRQRRVEFEFATIEGIPRGGGSSWQSVTRGAGDIESDFLNGEIVLLGRLFGVPTPANIVVQALGHELVDRGLSTGSVSIAEVKRRIRARELSL